MIEYGVLLGCAAVVIDEDVAHDGIQPGLDIGAILGIFLVCQCPEQGSCTRSLADSASPGQGSWQMGANNQITNSAWLDSIVIYMAFV